MVLHQLCHHYLKNTILPRGREYFNDTDVIRYTLFGNTTEYVTENNTKAKAAHYGFDIMRMILQLVDVDIFFLHLGGLILRFAGCCEYLLSYNIYCL